MCWSGGTHDRLSADAFLPGWRWAQAWPGATRRLSDYGPVSVPAVPDYPRLARPGLAV